MRSSGISFKLPVLEDGSQENPATVEDSQERKHTVFESSASSDEDDSTGANLTGLDKKFFDAE